MLVNSVKPRAFQGSKVYHAPHGQGSISTYVLRRVTRLAGLNSIRDVGSLLISVMVSFEECREREPRIVGHAIHSDIVFG